MFAKNCSDFAIVEATNRFCYHPDSKCLQKTAVIMQFWKPQIAFVTIQLQMFAKNCSDVAILEATNRFCYRRAFKCLQKTVVILKFWKPQIAFVTIEPSNVCKKLQ